jgi:predicted GH43/DUF377 family glycosyl hydrolase
MPIERFAENPLITPADVVPSRPDYEVLCAFNPAAGTDDPRPAGYLACFIGRCA